MLAAAIAVAISFWGPPTCATAYHVAPTPAPALGVMAQHTGWCEVIIDSERPWLWWELCAVVVHETGHAHGVGHSFDPRDVMFPRLERRARVCIGKRPAQYQRGQTIRFG